MFGFSVPKLLKRYWLYGVVLGIHTLRTCPFCDHVRPPTVRSGVHASSSVLRASKAKVRGYWVVCVDWSWMMTALIHSRRSCPNLTATLLLKQLDW